MNSPRPRLFLAVPARLERYGEIRRDFGTLIEGRWTPEAQLHATLCFFGERFDTAELLGRLEKIDFTIDASGVASLGYFKRSNILYAESENTSLLRLYKDVSNELELSSSHRFTPHVTLMRIKKIVDRQTFFERLEHYRNQPLGRLQNRAALYSSELHRGGARYTLLKEWRS